MSAVWGSKPMRADFESLLSDILSVTTLSWSRLLINLYSPWWLTHMELTWTHTLCSSSCSQSFSRCSLLTGQQLSSELSALLLDLPSCSSFRWTKYVAIMSWIWGNYFIILCNFSLLLIIILKKSHIMKVLDKWILIPDGSTRWNAIESPSYSIQYMMRGTCMCEPNFILW